MLLLQMIEILRGWLQDKIPAGGLDSERQWTNVALRRFINLGLRDAEKIIIGVDPEAFKCTYVTDIVIPTTGEDALYEWPAGTWAVIEVATSSDGVNYLPLDRVTLADARSGRLPDRGGFIHYSRTHFMLAPSPPSAIVNGLRVIVAPTLVMAVDTSQCPMPVGHETLVLKLAEKYARMDVNEPTDKLEAEIAALEQRVPKFYLTSHQPAFLEPIGYDGADYELS